MRTMKNTPIARGIQAVRAEAPSNAEVKAIIEALNKGFEDFKAKYDKKHEELQAAVDDANLKLGAAKTSNSRRDPNSDKLDGDGVKVLRSHQDFQAHYAAKAPRENGENSGGNKPTLQEFMSVVAGMKPKREDGVSNAVMAAMTVGTDSSGGFAVPHEVMPDILSAMVPASSLLQAGAGIVPMEFGAKTVSTVITENVPTASWRDELGEVAVSEPTFRANVAAPKSLATIVRISRELLADAEDADRALRTAIGQAFAKELDRVGLMGSGTSPEPRGLRNIAGVNQVPLGVDGTALANYRPLLAACGSIIHQNAPLPTAAIMSGRSLMDFEALVDTTGQPLRRPRLLETMAFHPTSQIPDNLVVGASTDTSELYVGDFSGLYFLMREALSIQLLREAYAKTGEIGFLCHVRADVVVNYPKQFTIVRGVRPAAA